MTAKPRIGPFGLGVVGCLLAAFPLFAQAPGNAVAARGRIKPKDGVLRLAGPSDFVAVVGKLNVDQGDSVQAGQVIAVMDTLPAREARVKRVQGQITAQEAAIVRARAELANARLERERRQQLSKDGVVADSERDSHDAKVAVAEAALSEAEAGLVALQAELRSAQAERDQSIVKSPISGQVLEVHARPGEKVGPEGILEMARTDVIYAVAEVYETDISRVKAGQRAVVRSPALGRELGGVVERVGLKVGKLQSLGTDQATRTDARIVEVEVRLDDPAAVAGLTNLEVEVLIRP